MPTGWSSNRSLIDLSRHLASTLRACRPYRAKMKSKVERPFRYIRDNFFFVCGFRNLDDLNAQLRHWLDTVANPLMPPPPSASSTRHLPRNGRASWHRFDNMLKTGIN
jgi:hypothetical protein